MHRKILDTDQGILQLKHISAILAFFSLQSLVDLTDERGHITFELKKTFPLGKVFLLYSNYLLANFSSFLSFLANMVL